MKKAIFTILGMSFIFASSAAFAEDHKDKDMKVKGHKGHFAKLDADKDGKVSLDEFLVRSKGHFTKIDANKDGSLTKDEMKSAHKKFKGRMEKRHERLKERRSERKTRKDSEAIVAE